MPICLDFILKIFISEIPMQKGKANMNNQQNVFYTFDILLHGEVGFYITEVLSR